MRNSTDIIANYEVLFVVGGSANVSIFDTV